MNFLTGNHGDIEARSIRRARVQRGRRPSVIGARDRRIRCRRRGVFLSRAQRPGNCTGRRREGRPDLILPSEHEVRIERNIVNRRGPQRAIDRNRMATVKSAERVGVAAPNIGHAGRYLVSSLVQGAKIQWKSSVAGKTKLGVRRSSTLRLPRGGQKSAILQFRPRHGAEGINTKGRSKQ